MWVQLFEKVMHNPKDVGLCRESEMLTSIPVSRMQFYWWQFKVGENWKEPAGEIGNWEGSFWGVKFAGA